MDRVIIESPFAGDVEANLKYLRKCMRDCLLRGESPYASHGLYTQPGVLNDDVPAEREHGIQAGFVWREASERSVVYCDQGVSRGMVYGIKHAAEMGHPIEYRMFMGYDQAKTVKVCCLGDGTWQAHWSDGEGSHFVSAADLPQLFSNVALHCQDN